MATESKDIENLRLEIERERLAIERAKSQFEARFTQRHIGTILTAAISLAAVVVSVSQVWSAYVTKDREIALAQAQKDRELSVLQSQKDRDYEALTAQNNREWNLNIAKFVSEHADVIFGGNQEQRRHIQDVMLATFPPNITNIIFHRLERAANSPETRIAWRNARRSLPAVVRDVSATPPTSPDSSNTIIVDSPARNASVVSPLRISGKALSSWFFEGDFSVELVDEDGNTIATGIAQAKGDWTQNGVFVPFSAQMTFSSAKTKKGYLILEYDSPKDGTPIERYQMPVSFVESR